MMIRTAVLSWLALSLIGCSQSRSDSSDSSATSSSKGSLPAPDTSLKCSSFSRHECMSATHCTLVLAPTDTSANYLCRDAQGSCEQGIAQGNARACKARDGCTFDQGGCYCHCKGYGRTAIEDKASAPGCACACAGGPPPRCRATDEPPSLPRPSATSSATASSAPADSSAPSVAPTASTTPSSNAAGRP